MAKISYQKCIPYDYSFNERLYCQKLFEFHDKEVVSFIRSQIFKNTYVGVIYSVIKYMLHGLGIQPVDVRRAISKYTVAIVYSYIMASKKISDNSSYKTKELDDLLNDNISYDRLINLKIEGDSPFALLYNKNEIGDYNTGVDALRIMLEQDKASSVNNDIYRVLRLDYDFFSTATNINIFDNYDHLRRFDMLISEAVLDNGFFNFDFSIDSDSFLGLLSNLDSPNNDRNIRNSIIYIGYVVHKAIKSNIYIGQVTNPVELYIFKNATMDKDASSKFIKFVQKIDNTFVIDPRLIVPFVINYNGIMYLISKNGIEEYVED